MEAHDASIDGEELGLRRPPHKIQCPLCACRCTRHPHRSCCVCLSTGTTFWGVDGTISAWNATAAGRDGVLAGGTIGVATHDGEAATNEVPRAHEEMGCNAATGATERGGVGATAVCNAAVAGRDVASTGWSTGWRCAMTGRPRTRSCARPSRLNSLYLALSN